VVVHRLVDDEVPHHHEERTGGALVLFKHTNETCT
jgi:hypothetical protein